MLLLIDNRYSGITKEKLDPVTTTLPDIHVRLREIITPRTILVGHSLNSDLSALKLTHPFIIDTSILYPHPRGPPLKSSLKWLAQKYLSREIQRQSGTIGHDSVEDARACMDLLKQKCEKGPTWGTSDATGESIFKRLSRTEVDEQEGSFRTGAVVDWGEPRRGHGAQATVSIGCENDMEIVEGIKKAVNGDTSENSVPHGGVDFVWGRLRELEAVRGWWNRTKTADNAELLANAMSRSNGNDTANEGEDSETKLSKAVTKAVKHVLEVYESLPPHTAFIVYSGTGDPREVGRLQAMQQQFKKDYQVKKWDEIDVKWTDTEEQALRAACREARSGIGFIAVK